MSNQEISINAGGGVDGTGALGQLEIGTDIPGDISAGCVVYLFSDGRLTGMDIVIEEMNPSNPAQLGVSRMRSHTDLSVLDRVCVEAILTHYDQNPPNEVFCKLKKLDIDTVRELSAVPVASQENVVDIVPAEIEEKPNAS